MAKQIKNRSNSKSKHQSRWRVELVKERPSGTFYYVIGFRTVDGKRGTRVFSRSGSGRVEGIVNDLKQNGAKFPRPDTEHKFVKELLQKAEKKGVTADLMVRCGWHGDALVPPASKVSFTRHPLTGRRIWLRPPNEKTYLGASKGDLQGWKGTVGEASRTSSFAMFAIGAALAGPLIRHAAVSESAIFNFAGKSSKGKTTAAKVAASVSGNPSTIADWNATETALEELCAASSDFLMVLDDIERSREGLAKTLKGLLHIMAGGSPRKRARHVSSSFSDVDWCVVAIMTSPEPIKEFMTRKGVDTTLGDRVRVLDLVVPEVDTGIFDRLPDGVSAADQARRLEEGFSTHHGVLLKTWIKELPQLIEEIHVQIDKRLAKREERIGRKMESYEKRAFRKLILPVIAANEARNLGLLPWTGEDIKAMYQRVVQPTMAGLWATENPHHVRWAEFAEQIEDGQGFFDLREGQELERPLRTKDKGPAATMRSDIGVMVQEDGQVLVGLTNAWITRLGTPNGNPIIDTARALQGMVDANFGDLAEQRRFPCKTGILSRTRLLYLPKSELEKLVRQNAGPSYERWWLKGKS